ncbi:MAG: MFS transporter [Legionella sp.]|nr:MFS transporter [Legionella sp.]
MWFFPLIFFAFQFILRLWPGLMMQEILAQFSIDAASFGLLAAFYYYGYAGMQIPTALLLDRYGARVVVFAFATLCGLGAFLFIFTNNFYLAILSRFLIGAGSAVGFLGTSKVVSEWFSNSQYPKMIGFSFSIGLLGAIYGGKPISQLIQSFGGQHLGQTLAYASILIGILTFLFLRSPQQTQKTQTSDISLSHCSVLLSSVLWALAFANLLMAGALEGFADVWGIPYLMSSYGFSRSDAALLTSIIFVGILLGGPFLAFLSKKIGNYAVLGLCGLGLTLSFLLLLSHYIDNWWLLCALFFFIGILCCYQVIMFAAGSTLVPHKYLGITIAFLNCFNMLGGSFFHTLIGKIMDFYWEGTLTQAGLRVYSLQSYHHALMLIPFSALIGTSIIVWIQCRVKKQSSTLVYG